jgi:hypothetical protein
MKKCTNNKQSNRSIEESLKWLDDMELFNRELKMYIATLPTAFNIESIKGIPLEVIKDPVYGNLCRVSTECEYMDKIPKEECNEKLLAVLQQSRNVFLDIRSNPSLNVFQGIKKSRPFYEKALVASMSLAVEHNIVF